MFTRITISPKKIDGLWHSDIAIIVDIKALLEAMNESNTLHGYLVEIESITKEKQTLKIHGLLFHQKTGQENFVSDFLIRMMKELGLYNLYDITKLESIAPNYSLVSDYEESNKRNVKDKQQISPLPKEVTDLIKPDKLTSLSRDKILELALRSATVNKDATYLLTFIKDVKNVNAQDDNPKIKKTALHWAIEKEKPESFRVLTKFGAKWTIKDATEKCPYDLICASTNAEFMAIVKRYAGKIIIAADKQNTQFHIKVMTALECIREDSFKAKKLDLILQHNVIFVISFAKSDGRLAEFDFTNIARGSTKINVYATNFGENDSEYLEAALAHEIEHAFKVFVHFITDIKSPKPHDPSFFKTGGPALPFYPYNTVEKDKFKQLIIKGDKNLVMGIHSIFNKKRQGLPLSKEEEANYHTIVNKLGLYRPHLKRYEINPEFSKELAEYPRLKDDVNNGKIKVRISSVCGHRIPFYISSISDNGHIKGFHADNLSDRTEQGLSLVYEILTRDSIPDHPYDLICEQHARTIGEFPTEIIKFFYPEISVYDETEYASVSTTAMRP